MALLRGCHVIGVSDPGKIPWMAQEILKKGLLVDTSVGTAAFAYYVDMVPIYWEQHPMVIFDVDEQYVIRVECTLPNKRADYAFMKMSGTLFTYIPIVVRGFLNISWLASYPRTAIGFF